MLGKKESKSDGELRRKHWFCIRGNISAGPHAPSTPGPLIRHKVYSLTAWNNLDEAWHIKFCSSCWWLQTLPRIFLIFQQPMDLVMVFRSRKNGVKLPLNFERLYLSSGAKIKISETAFCKFALLSFCENRFCVWRFVKKLKLTKRGASFRHFWVPKDH